MILWVGTVVMVVAAALLLARQWMLHGLPEDSVQIPFSEVEKQLEIPPRPGIRGIEISGPEIKAKRFEIDLSRSDLKELDWQQLLAVDPHAQIIVSGFVDNQGRLTFTQRDVRMEGHPLAGIMIEQALKTWMYTPFKTGPIVFTFNLPSEGRKVLVDASGLRRRKTIPEEVPLLNGQLYYVEGIPPQEVRQIGGSD